MAKKRLSIIVAIFAGMMLLFNSCTKVSENFIIGKWEVISYQFTFYDEDGWMETMYTEYEKITISFRSNGSYSRLDVDIYGDSDYEQGTWNYIEDWQKLKFSEVLWDVYRHKNKEMELRYEGPNDAAKMYLKKIE